ncbi:hypothetical protein SAMN04488057_105291 [Cyclobacterium lianum]|uniref:Uncharacterized protein n=1 Tax=Cyclobacterium lianum TaxID=388280 RepID=A0A1M7NFX2_9BACT|nr:hypothetical protein [Cyclobacterium lianum]SHN02591.1 hypothetical protein SAMN04488057_105291 [Cyclobacterium lianum]
MVFKEEQYLRKIWLLPLFLVLSLLFGIIQLLRTLFGDAGLQDSIALTLLMAVMGLVLWLLLTMKLEIRMDDWGLSFKSPPFVNSWKKYSWENIQHIEPVSTRATWRTGGIGIRYSLSGEWRYIFSVRHAIRVHLKKGSFVLSTQKPEELMAAWENWKLVK